MKACALLLVACASSPPPPIAPIAPARPADPARVECLPQDPDGIGWVGNDLVACGFKFCRTIDPRSGIVTTRPFVPLVGIGTMLNGETSNNCYDGMCWPSTAREPTLVEPRVAVHPDRLTTAISTMGRMARTTTFDPSKRAQHSFVRRSDDFETTHLWFAGGIVFLEIYHGTDPATLELTNLDGKVIETVPFGGGSTVGITRSGAAIIQLRGLAEVRVLDPKTPRIVHGTFGKPPIPVSEGEIAIEDDTSPFESTLLVDAGDDFIGLHREELVVFDGKTLAVKSRVPVKRCPYPRGD